MHSTQLTSTLKELSVPDHLHSLQCSGGGWSGLCLGEPVSWLTQEIQSLKLNVLLLAFYFCYEIGLWLVRLPSVDTCF